MRRLRHVPALDGLRGIAILLVLGVHADFLVPGGWLGVELFFVLSGFLITSLLLTELSKSGGVSLRGFYRRRALRLVPALVLVLAVYTAFVTVRYAFGLGGDVGLSLAGVIYGLTYTTNLVDAQSVPWELRHLWSLAQEEQFYILWPLALLACIRLGAGPRLMTAGLIAAVVVTQAGFGFNSLVVGCIAGVLFSYGLVQRVPLVVATVALAPAVFCLWVFAYELRSDEMVLFFAVPAAVVLLAAVTAPQWWVSRALGTRVLGWFGKISYGLYLWHWPIFVAVGWKLGAPLAILVAALSYRYVEEPFLRRKRSTRGSGDEIVPAPASALPPRQLVPNSRTV